MRKLCLLLCLAASLSAKPVISRIVPPSAPAAGGTVVTIEGSGFQICNICSPALPEGVRFGGVEARFVTHVDEHTLKVTVPPHFPGTVDVTVDQFDGSVAAPRAFTYTGTLEEEFDRILLPLFTPPITGAFGSQFVTELRLANSASSQPALVFGLQTPCILSPCLPIEASESPLVIGAGQSLRPGDFDYTGNPGRFVYVAKTDPDVFANLRVYDSSRSAFNFGTEIPVVRERELVTGPIKLLGVPLDPRFRNTLRIYGASDAALAAVTIGDQVHLVPLTSGRDLFEPAYGVFTAFPIGTGAIDVTVTGVSPLPVIGAQPPAIWAFVSVTNNDTQLITTISPQN